MRRTVCCVGLVVLMSVLASTWLAGQPKGGPKEDEESVPRWPELIPVLAKADAWGGLEQDKEITLSKALDELAKNSKWRGVWFDIDERAFKAAGISSDFPIVGEKEITGGTMTLATVLKKILERLPEPGGTCLLRRDHFEITTIPGAREEIWGKGHPGPFLPLVHAFFEDRPLSAALRALANQSGRNVALDRRVAAKGKTLVTASFRNMPLDTAVELLARDADLEVVVVESGLYVTTRAEAKVLSTRRGEKRERAREQRRQHEAGRARQEALKTWQELSALSKSLRQFGREQEAAWRALVPERKRPMPKR